MGRTIKVGRCGLPPRSGRGGATNKDTLKNPDLIKVGQRLRIP